MKVIDDKATHLCIFLSGSENGWRVELRKGWDGVNGSPGAVSNAEVYCAINEVIYGLGARKVVREHQGAV